MDRTSSDVIHGIVVNDPYRWLEKSASSDTRNWVALQRIRARKYFSDCPYFPEIATLVRRALYVEALDQPQRVQGFDYFRKRFPMDEQASICMRHVVTGQEYLLVNPAPQGHFAATAIYRLSLTGRFLAYETRLGGSKSAAVNLLDTQTRSQLPLSLAPGLLRGLVFRPNEDGFYYCQETNPNDPEHTIRFQRLSSSKEGQIAYRVARSHGSRLILIGDTVHLGAVLVCPGPNGTTIDLSISRIERPATWRQIFSGRLAPFSPVLAHGRLFAYSRKGAHNGHLIELTLDGQELRTVVPEQGVPLQQFRIARDRVYVTYLNGVTPSFRMWSLDGSPFGEIQLPSKSSISLTGTHCQDDNHCFYSCESFVHPPCIYDYDPDLKDSSVWYQHRCTLEEPSAQISKATVLSRDRTPVPITVISNAKDASRRQRPALLNAYGAFGFSVTPKYSPFSSIMRQLGVILVVPHVRGGGEFGEQWHVSGSRRRRQASVDDFIAVAEHAHLFEIDHQRIAAFGGCNGGLLVLAATVQRPDLLRAVVAIAPFTDMVRYEHFNLAAKWSDEYGTVNDSDDFKALYAYSPYHNIQNSVNYPATLFVTGDQDDVCNPAHTRKMVALLQNRPGQTAPIVMDYREERGHMPVLPLSIRSDAVAQRVAFLVRELDIQVP